MRSRTRPLSASSLRCIEMRHSLQTVIQKHPEQMCGLTRLGLRLRSMAVYRHRMIITYQTQEMVPLSTVQKSLRYATAHNLSLVFVVRRFGYHRLKRKGRVSESGFALPGRRRDPQ